MAATLQGRKVANEGVEQVELTEPWQAVEAAGGTPSLLAPEATVVQAFDHLDKADTFEPDSSVADADPDDYVALVLPGGDLPAFCARLVEEIAAGDEAGQAAARPTGTG